MSKKPSLDSELIFLWPNEITAFRLLKLPIIESLRSQSERCQSFMWVAFSTTIKERHSVEHAMRELDLIRRIYFRSDEIRLATISLAIFHGIYKDQRVPNVARYIESLEALAEENDLK